MKYKKLDNCAHETFEREDNGSFYIVRCSDCGEAIGAFPAKSLEIIQMLDTLSFISSQIIETQNTILRLHSPHDTASP